MSVEKVKRIRPIIVRTPNKIPQASSLGVVKFSKNVRQIGRTIMKKIISISLHVGDTNV